MDEAVLILAGGAARRFPNKLEHLVEGQPMIVRLFERLRNGRRPVYLAVKGDFTPEVDAALGAPLLVDRHPGAGPLQALLSASPQIPAQRIFAVAGDQVWLDLELLERLAAARRPGDEAIVPRHAGGIEPLGALYDRGALLREGVALRRGGRHAMRDLIARLATRFVTLDEGRLRSANRIGDLEGLTQTA